MEDQTKCQMGMQRPDGCGCGTCQGKVCGIGGCMMNHGCGHRIIRLVLGIIILVVVFSLGVKLGELKAAFETNSGRGMMHLQYYGGGYGGAYPMMQNSYGQGGMMRGNTQAVPAQ